jgi:uncharacterized protein involved in exopolysaccharide biosynthesis
MNLQVQLWMPPILAMFGSLIVVVITAWFNTRALSAQIEAVRAEMRAEMAALRAEMKGDMAALLAEMKQNFAELRLEFHKDLTDLTRRVERLEELRGLVRL